MKIQVRREMNNGAGCRTEITIEDEIQTGKGGKTQLEVEQYLNSLGFRPQGRVRRAFAGIFG